MNKAVCCYISMGSNQGDRERLLKAAHGAIGKINGVQLCAVSSLFRTEPQGDKEQPWFCNQVAKLSCTLSPLELLQKLQSIETSLGRVRTERRFGPRSMDLDILLFGGIMINTPELNIPHPHMKKRAFVLVPLAELEPELVHPDGSRIKSILSELEYTLSGDKIYQNL